MVDTVQHKSLPASSLHEDKLIASATTADAGKVTTPSGSTNGVGVLRKLTLADLDTSGVTTADHGKVLTPSGTTNGAVEWSKPAWDDLTHTVATTDAGKAWTPSATTANTMELRQLAYDEIDHSGSALLSVISVSETPTYSATAATDLTLNTVSDYVTYPFTLNVIESQHITYNAAEQSFTIGSDVSAAEKFLMIFDCTITSSANNTTVGIAYVKDGSLVPYRFKIRGNTAGDYMVGSRTRTMDLAPGDKLYLKLACDKSCTLTQRDVSFSWTHM